MERHVLSACCDSIHHIHRGVMLRSEKNLNLQHNICDEFLELRSFLWKTRADHHPN